MKISNVGSVGTVRPTTSTSGESSNDMSVQTDIVVSESTDIQQTNLDQSEEDQNIINDEMLDMAVEQANKSLSQYNRYIERSVHETTKAIMYVMKDTKTDEVIREFPPKRIQDMIAKMWELAGLFIDEKA